MIHQNRNPFVNMTLQSESDLYKEFCTNIFQTQITPEFIESVRMLAITNCQLESKKKDFFVFHVLFAVIYA